MTGTIGVLVIGCIAALALRCLLATQPHSGEGLPPMHGDYEAQRHWLEITTALHASEWYVNSTDNDLLYWGLDYPPLTAFHSYILGTIGNQLYPSCFSLHTSRGIETPQCRFFMRASVVGSDLLVYLPGCLLAVWGVSSPNEKAPTKAATVVGLLMLPPLALIDHGHFQYNGVCFGFCLAAVGLIAKGWIKVGSACFVCGLLFKQIALYYAFAFFFCILGFCWHDARNVFGALTNVASVGVVVISTTILQFAPWLVSSEPVSAVRQVLHRMFPFARGLYEDKVANVWCTISIVFKMHRFVPATRVPLVCACITLAVLLPGCAYCLTRQSGRRSSFVAALSISSLAFFLFAFQVHEKGILFPCVAISLLPLALGPEKRPSWAYKSVCHFCIVSLFSMYPLVVKDKLQLAYASLIALLTIACEVLPGRPSMRIIHYSTYFVGLAIHGVHGLVSPPARYPDLWTMLITGSSCAYFVLCLGSLSVMQLKGAFDTGSVESKKNKKAKSS